MDGRNERDSCRITGSRDSTAAYGEEAWQTVGGKGADFRKWVCVMISTPGTRFPRAVQGASSAFACGVFLGHAFPAGVSYLTFQSAGTSFFRDIVGELALLLQFVFSLAVPSIFRQKEFRIALAPNHNLKQD
ncbi:hypothetical protein [Peribacillus frigoritolerans]|uniref:Uncharacterized protein n=1 Tax=Peribacillus frigoritolerans TaxID=450367 RepID=A0AAJ1QS95_9BACI|nr:hypothetical protein [Peribacillus frigoritolerans]MDM5286661.1 hypothetical protein [Peribacillus frigoritolerans]